MKKQKGQALITLVVFIIISVTIATAAVILVLINSTSSSKYQDSVIAYSIAESGLENALLRMLRDTAYVGETMAIGSGSATIVVSGTNPKIATSTATFGNFQRKVQAVMNYTNGYYTFSLWKEVE